MSSTRLSGKVMKLVDEKNPSLFYTINQLKACKNLDKIIVATTTLPEDDVIENYLNELGMDVFRGSSDDVLDRYLKCARQYELSTVVRITADCPLIDPDIVDRGVEIFKSGNHDYVTNTYPRTFPDGNETEIFSINALEKAWNNSKLPSEHEHVTPYFRNNPESFQIKNFTHNTDISYLRWTVDYNEDFELVKILISKIKPRPVHLENILNVLNSEPNLLELNKNHKPNEGYAKSLEEDKNS
jgi:spore coat polysaccharide biosynthesis protein SpsF